MKRLLAALLAALTISTGALAAGPTVGPLQAQNNLKELSNAATARTNLGLGSAATMPSNAFDTAGAASSVAAAALQKSNNLSDIGSAATARTNLGLGTASTQPSSAFDPSGAAAAAQATANGAIPSNGGNGSAAVRTANGGVTPRSFAAWAADIINPREFGAVGDGNIHPAGAALGITTLAQLAAYTLNGVTPYSFINAYPYGVLFNLDLGQDAAAGATTLNFQTTATIGSLIPVSASAASGASSVTLSDKTMTDDGTIPATGTPIVCTNASGVVETGANTTTGAITGGTGGWVVALSTPTVGALPANLSVLSSGSYCQISVSPPTGSYIIPVIYTKGAHRGEIVTGSSCLPAGAQTDDDNPALMQIKLSAPLICQPATGAVLTLTPAWMSRVSAGMTVQGPTGTIPAGDTVSAVNTSTGQVTLASGLLAAIAARTPTVNVATEVDDLAQITFYRPYTDAEATALQMDRLGIQASINKMSSAGGNIKVPDGTYQIDGPLILPVSAVVGYDAANIAISGNSENRNAVTFAPTADFGPSEAVISCGDPTAKASNGRGIYTGISGYQCPGTLTGVRLKYAGFNPSSTSSFTFGLRPQWGGVPVQMDGIKAGPRLTLRTIEDEGFDSAILFAGDHTGWYDVKAAYSFDCIRMDDQQGNLFGDEVWSDVTAAHCSRGALTISPNVYFNGIIDKPYFAYSGYGLFLQPGIASSNAMQGSSVRNANMEGNSLGVVKDGGTRDSYYAFGQARTILDTHWSNQFPGPNATRLVPAGGGTWYAYWDLFGLAGVTIDDVWSTTYPIVNGATGVFRIHRVDAFSNNAGGLVIGQGDGDGLYTLLAQLTTAGQQLINGPGPFNNDYVNSLGFLSTKIIGPNWEGMPFPVNDAGITTIPLGTVMEVGVPQISNTIPTVERAGLSATLQPIVGVACQSQVSNPTSLRLPILCVGGTHIPALVSAAVLPGTLLKSPGASATMPGTAVAATSATDGLPLGWVSGVGSSTLGYVTATFAGER